MGAARPRVERPTGVSKIYAHVADPIPSVRDEVQEVPEELDAIIAKAMAKRPADRFGSAGELAAALGHALQTLDTAERLVAAPEPRPDETDLPTVMTDDATTRIEPTATANEPATTWIEPTASANEPAGTVTEPGVASPPAGTRVAGRSRSAPSSHRSPFLWLVPIVVLSLAAVLIATFSDNPTHPGKTSATSPPTPAPAATQIQLQGGA